MLVLTLTYFLSIFLFCSFVGYSLSLLILPIDNLRRLVIAPVIGYGALTIIIANLSYLGFGTNQIALPIALLLFFIGSILILIKRQIVFSPLENHYILWLTIIAALINTIIVLAPTIIGHAPSLFNDNTTYISIAEYIRHTGYLIPAQPKIELWQDNIQIYQLEHLRMGAQFFVSFLAALFQTTHTISIYPAIIGFIAYMFMTAIGFFYVTIRNNQTNILECTSVLFFSLIAINLNSNMLGVGFVPQTGGIILLISLIALAYDICSNNKNYYICIGLLLASLIITYNEITVFYCCGAFFYTIYQYFYKKIQYTKTLFYFGLTHILAFLVSPIGTKEFILGIISSYKTNGVGRHINSTLVNYWNTILGQDFYLLAATHPYRLLFTCGALVSFFFLYLILRKTFLKTQRDVLQFLITWSLPFVIGISIYAFISRDPFTQEVGHTWNVFKLVNWSYWFIPIIVGLATYSFAKEQLYKKAIVVLSIALLFPSLIANTYANYKNQTLGMITYTGNASTPFDEFSNLTTIGHNYTPANLIDYNSHPNYPYLILSILKDQSRGDFQFFNKAISPATDQSFYPWINYRLEQTNTSQPIDRLAGFFIYPKGTASAYFLEGFSQRETQDNTHYAWMINETGKVKILVPHNKKIQLSSFISNWQNQKADFEVYLGNKLILASNTDSTPIPFTTPVLGEGIHEVLIKYKGQAHTPDQYDGRKLTLLFKKSSIVEVQ